MLGGAHPSSQRLRQQNHLEVPVQPLLYRGSLSPKRKEIWSSVMPHSVKYSSCRHEGLRSPPSTHIESQAQWCVPVIPARGSRRQEDAGGLLASWSGWVSALRILRVLFKIRQWEVEEDSDAPPEALCMHIHTQQMRDFKNFFHEFEFLCFCVCLQRVSASSCGVCSPLPSLSGN